MFKTRMVMFTASSFWVALILVVLVFRGGGAVPVEPEFTPAPPPLTADAGSLAERARVAADVGDYEEAWRLYYEALDVAPEDVSLWYGLGVTLSHLNRRADTAVTFQRVVEHGQPDSAEVKFARQWLVNAGVLAEPVTFTIAAEEVDVRGDKAMLKGQTAWGDPDPSRPVLKAQLLLQGLSGAAEGQRFHTRVTLGEPYHFERLPAGTYRLLGGVAGHRLWDVMLSVEDGTQISLDLGQDNSSDPAASLHL